MSDFFSQLGAWIGLAGGAAALVISIGTIIQRKNAPTEKKWREMEEWCEGVNRKLDADKRHIDAMEKSFEAREDFERITLTTLKGLLEHMAEGNHIDAMRQLSRDIDDYLIRR